MAAFNKFEQFVADLAAGVHDAAVNTSTDTLKIYLTTNAPSASLDSVIADLAESVSGTGYTAGGDDTLNTTAESTGTITVSATDVVWTAGAGGFTTFQYVILYNDTPAAPLDPLIGWWDHGSAVVLANTETFTVAFGGNDLFTLA